MARSKQGVGDWDPGDDGYSWIATEDDCLTSYATTWVAKGRSSSDTGKINHGALYLSAETTAEGPTSDDLSGTTGDTARGALRTGGLSSDVHCVVSRGSGASRAVDERDPVSEFRLRLAAHWALAQARLVKYRRSIINNICKDACATQSPNTR